MTVLINSPLNGRAESGQDHFAYQHNQRRNTGTFLDIGANEPVRWNNTYALEEVGWRGVGIDFEPSYTPMWAAERKSPFICADATTIDWAGLKLPAVIDYLSLDIDETPAMNITTTILKNLFAAGLRFNCMTIEHDFYRHGAGHRDEIRKLCWPAGYVLKHPDVEIRLGNGKPYEDWWVRG